MAKLASWKWCAVTVDEFVALLEQFSDVMSSRMRLSETRGIRGLTVDGIFFYVPRGKNG